LVHKRRIVTSLKLGEVNLRRRNVSEDVHDDPLDVVDLDNGRGPLLAHDPRPSDRRGEETRPGARVFIQRADAVGGRVHVLTHNGTAWITSALTTKSAKISRQRAANNTPMPTRINRLIARPGEP